MNVTRLESQRSPVPSAIWVAATMLAFLCDRPTLGQTVLPSFELLPRTLVEARLRQVKMNNSKRQITLRMLFEEAGCTGESLAEQSYRKKRPPNLICTLRGATDSVIVVGAHFDHNTEYGEGVVDDWSGAALLPTIFQSFRGTPARHTLEFVGFGGEEQYMAGSRFFAGHLSEEQASKTKAMVSLECLGLGPPKVWVSHADKTLLRGLVEVAQALGISLAGVNVEKVGKDDSDSFAKRGIPTLTLHSVTQETLSILHSSSDNVRVIKFEDYYNSYRLIVAYLAYLDTTLP